MCGRGGLCVRACICARRECAKCERASVTTWYTGMKYIADASARPTLKKWGVCVCAVVVVCARVRACVRGVSVLSVSVRA